jgi:hypothetical protein
LGIVADSPSVENVVTSVKTLFESNQELEKISENIKRFKANNNWETFSNLILDTYNRLKLN